LCVNVFLSSQKILFSSQHFFKPFPPNWDVLIRILEEPEMSEVGNDDVSSVHNLSYDDRAKWKEIITTQSSLRTMLTEAVVREDFERIRQDTRYEHEFLPAVVTSPPAVTSHTVDDVYLRTVTEKKTIEDIESHKRRVTEYKSKPRAPLPPPPPPQVDPKFDVRVRNYPSDREQQLWENFSDISSASGLTLTPKMERSELSLPPAELPAQIHDNKLKLTSPELVGNMKPIEVPPQDKDVPNWDVLIRILDDHHGHDPSLDSHPGGRGRRFAQVRCPGEGEEESAAATIAGDFGYGKCGHSASGSEQSVDYYGGLRGSGERSDHGLTAAAGGDDALAVHLCARTPSRAAGAPDDSTPSHCRTQVLRLHSHPSRGGGWSSGDLVRLYRWTSAQ